MVHLVQVVQRFHKTFREAFLLLCDTAVEEELGRCRRRGDDPVAVLDDQSLQFRRGELQGAHQVHRRRCAGRIEIAIGAQVLWLEV